MSFTYQDKQLVCERVVVAEIAARVGTPFYLYSAQQLRENFNAYKTAFAAVDATICFAVKSCSNIAILKLLNAAGAGADTVSGGEIRRALGAGIAPEKISLMWNRRRSWKSSTASLRPEASKPGFQCG